MTPKLVGIVNITPDSFSDGGTAFSLPDAQKAIEHAMLEGADMVDLGAESTRPGATKLSSAEEWARISPVLEWASARGVPLSVDTRHPETAKRALDTGVGVINDVSGFVHPAMVAAVKNYDARLVMMHSLSIPADPAQVMTVEDCVPALIAWAHARADTLEKGGISRARILFDPGVGFGKTAAQSWQIIKRASEFHVLGLPLYIGHSRKSFLGGAMETRDAATLEVSRALLRSGVHYLRVHNVPAHRALLKEVYP